MLKRIVKVFKLLICRLKGHDFKHSFELKKVSFNRRLNYKVSTCKRCNFKLEIEYTNGRVKQLVKQIKNN